MGKKKKKKSGQKKKTTLQSNKHKKNHNQEGIVSKPKTESKPESQLHPIQEVPLSTKEKQAKILKEKVSDKVDPTHADQKNEQDKQPGKIQIEPSNHTYQSAFIRKFSKTFRVLKVLFRIFKFTFISVLILTILGTGTAFGVWYYFGQDLPNVTKLQEMSFAETTHLYDRNGTELYKFFQEDREYVTLDKISPHVIQALIAIEDKNFYKHYGFDIFAIVRVLLRNAQTDDMQGASTLTQQLARNIFLTPDQNYERKIKELLLALQIEHLFEKDKILEMYFNKISFGNNTYGIEAAAQTYFGISAKDLSLAQASVLASLPKSASFYYPLGPNVDKLMGYCKAGDQSNPLSNQGQDQVEVEVVEDENAPKLTLTVKPQTRLWIRVITDNQKKDYILNADEERIFTANETLQINLGHKNVNLFINGKKIKEIESRKLLTYNLENWQQAVEGGENGADPNNNQNEQSQNQSSENQPQCTSPFDPNYVWGRKDLVLNRMVIDKYITQEQMVEAWKEGLTLKFKKPVYNIKAPHFVFYVKSVLEQKYGKEMVENGGLQVKTTLDLNLQQIAEKAIADFAEKNERQYKANNAALIAVNPQNGEILSMVGSRDYWNASIDGQVNVTTSLRQPGSSFKPFVFAAAIENAGIGSGTYLNDFKTIFNQKDMPQNYDGRFLGRMTIRRALGGSRNIPAIKAYYVAGEEEKMLDFVDKLGMTSLREFRDEFNKKADERGWTFYYGWPMAIGSGEVRLIDLVSGYATFGNEGKYIPPYPILEVRDRNGKLLEKYEGEEHEKKAMDPQTAYIMSSILSDVSARPAGSWRNMLTIPGHNVAAKTGTSNKVERGIRLPNNNLTIGYTPSLAAGIWVGNTDGSSLRSSAYSLYTADPIYHQFFTEALKDKEREEFKEPEGIKKIGKEVYPSWGDPKKTYEKMFKTVKPPPPPKVEPLPDFIPFTPEERAKAEAARKAYEEYQKIYGDQDGIVEGTEPLPDPSQTPPPSGP